MLEEDGLDRDGEVILRRVQTADGKTRAFVNDAPVSVQTLRRIGHLLVEIHGQHDERALVDPASHRALLDAFGGLTEDAGKVAGAWQAMRAAEQELQAARESHEKAVGERDYLNHTAEELALLDPTEGEETALAERRHAMMHAEKVAGDLQDALEAVGGATSPTPVLAAALRNLERRSEQLPQLLQPVVTALDQALAGLESARETAESALRETELDPRELDDAEERLFALRAAARKHQVQVDDLSAVRSRLEAQLAALESGDEHLKALDEAAAAARKKFEAAAGSLSKKRAKAAAALDKAVNGELSPLKLEQARFETRVGQAGEPGPSGLDQVAFFVQTNPGTEAGPLMKIASGGELSRFTLALKVALADRGSAPTLVFDEIDTAVSGAVSDAIGARLSRLSGNVQVLSVTHAPQVAARADSHYLIAKEFTNGGGEMVATRVAELDGPARLEEIARMLAGATVTDEARAAAQRLVAGDVRK